MRIQVKDFMSAPVITAVAEQSVDEILELMNQRGIRAVPVIKYKKQLPQADITIQGIVTSSDIHNNMSDLKVSDVMTNSVHVIHVNTSAKSAAKMMLKHKVHHLVAMQDGKIVGMVSSLDFVDLVARYGSE